MVWFRVLIWVFMLLMLAALSLRGYLGSEIWAEAPVSSLERPGVPVLERVMTEKTLRVMTQNRPTTFFFGSHGAQGFEYDLAASFADHLGVALDLRTADTVEEIINAVAADEIDVGASGILRVATRERRVLFSDPYFDVTQQVVCRRGVRLPRSVRDLTRFDVLVADGGAADRRLAQLKQLHPALDWRRTEESDDQVFEHIDAGSADCTVADSHVVRINRHYFPELVVAFDISRSTPLAWALPPRAHSLQRAVNRWIKTIEGSGELDELVARNFAHVQSFDYVDIRAFHRRIQKRLPELRPFFEGAANVSKIPWTVLAAQAYQESHWNPNARSPTGVRGLMMLTRVTARELGVDDRLDPEQSILGGARYLANLLARIPADIRGRDRFWFALAAYNVGMGHVHDAQLLARRLGYAPNVWSDVRQVLPLLSQKKYYKDLRHGYARGNEPVRYVEQIATFIDILDRYFARTHDMPQWLPSG